VADGKRETIRIGVKLSFEDMRAARRSRFGIKLNQNFEKSDVSSSFDTSTHGLA
jgi:hypothetical protein